MEKSVSEEKQDPELVVDADKDEVPHMITVYTTYGYAFVDYNKFKHQLEAGTKVTGSARPTPVKEASQPEEEPNVEDNSDKPSENKLEVIRRSAGIRPTC